ncbi:hypothetical protein [Schleiferilactobacillus perolens]|uniref:hypothetical protein n=1 Tax=Schleiferilactobacillus perolens TaxID=100468 RepID=UPI000ACF7BA3|nr:hypothetical protein [Schleiferilactobacillus perolens]
MTIEEQHLVNLLKWRNKITVMRILAGPSEPLNDLHRIADNKIQRLVRQHNQEEALA